MKLIKEHILASQKWTRTKEVLFLDREGKERSWTFIERTNGQQAVVVIPITEKSRSLILVRQFRVPFGREVIEFPAGLVDQGESPAEAAIRELGEETGYAGVVEEVGPPVSTSAGITTETVTMVRMRVSELPVATQRLEGSESIAVMRIGRDEAAGFLTKMTRENALFDAKVYLYLVEHSR